VSRQGKGTSGKKSAYSSVAAEEFWSNRLRSTDSLAAVLTYDAPAAANEAYDRWERQTLLRLLPKSLKGRKALDIGCGIGRITELLARWGADVTALDVALKMLQFCSAAAQQGKFKSKVEYICASAEAIPCGDRQFDIITCFGVLEHLPDMVRRACIAECARVLKPGGRLYLVVNNKDNLMLKLRKRNKTKAKGYHFELVGLDWVEKVCADWNLSVKLRAANLRYALVHYGMLFNGKSEFLSQRELKSLFDAAVKLDLRQPLPVPLYRVMASHFFMEVRRKK
jgi:ubiquinone/menaquinone biosynthesis C-methylase UbiE